MDPCWNDNLKAQAELCGLGETTLTHYNSTAYLKSTRFAEGFGQKTKGVE